MSDLNRYLIEEWEERAKREWAVLEAYRRGFVKEHTAFEAQIDLDYYRQWFQFWVNQYQSATALAS